MLGQFEFRTGSRSAAPRRTEGSQGAPCYLSSVLMEAAPWQVEEAWQDLKSRGAGWGSRARRGLGALSKRFPAERFGEWLT